MMLKDVCIKIGSGATPRGGKEAYKETGISLIRSQNVLDYSFSTDGLAYIDDVQARQLENVTVQKDDVLLNITGDSVARACIVNNQYLPARVNQHVAIVRGDSGKILQSYILYFLQMKKAELLQIASGGATRNALTKAMIEGLEINVPSLDMQHKIVAALDAIQAKIATNQKINDNLLQQARALFQHWVSDTSSILYKLSEVADINPETYSPKESWSFVNYLDTSSITSGRITDIQYIKPSEEKLPSRARRIIRENDVVFSTVRPNQLHYGIIPLPKPNMLGSTGFVVIRSKKDSIPNEIIYLAITEPTFVEQMQQLAEQSVSTFPSIRPNDLDACIIPEPREEDANFVSLVQSIFKTVAENNEENERLSALRDALLPRLMSGEIDVSSVTV